MLSDRIDPDSLPFFKSLPRILSLDLEAELH